MANSIPVRCRRDVLTAGGVQAIRGAALEILEVTGIAVRSEKVQRMLASAGCDVDKKSAVVMFPSNLVEEMARKNDRAVTFYGSTRKHDARLDFEHSHVCSDGNGTDAMDFETRKRRSSRKSDVAKSAFVALVGRIAGSLDQDSLADADAAQYLSFLLVEDGTGHGGKVVVTPVFLNNLSDLFEGLPPETIIDVTSENLPIDPDRVKACLQTPLVL